MQKSTVILLTTATVTAVPITIFLQKLTDFVIAEDQTELEKVSLAVAPPILGWVAGSMFAHLAYDVIGAILHK